MLRAFGGVGVRLSCSSGAYLFEKVGRVSYPDIDLVGYNKQVKSILNLMKTLGYELDWGVFSIERKMFRNNSTDLNVDLFLDRLNLCHVIDLRDKLEQTTYTLPATELLLTKLQIVKLNEKDVKDIILLLNDCYTQSGDRNNAIDVRYIAQLLSKDWGFYYTVTTNLTKTRSMLDKYRILEQYATILNKRIDMLLSVIEAIPKTFGWKLRARVGPSKKWYNDVEEVR